MGLYTFCYPSASPYFLRQSGHNRQPICLKNSMTTGILIIAHAPLASSLRACVLHVYPEAADHVVALDVPPNEFTDTTQDAVIALIAQLGTPQVLLLADVFGATPCNVAQRIVDGVRSKLVAGVNLPMLLRAVNYREEGLDALVARALSGGVQCIMHVASTAPQNQIRKSHDHNHNEHQQ
jgi:PTS system mannose-specific IIA component